MKAAAAIENGRLRSAFLAAALLCSLCSNPNGSSQVQPASPSKSEYDVLEGIFHDGLGTYAEIILANQIIAETGANQPPFDASHARQKMENAISRLPGSHPAVARLRQEIANIERAVKAGAAKLVADSGGAKLIRVRHTAREYSGARAGDLSLEFDGRPPVPVSVKTDKSGKVAVAEGQTPEIESKWAERYFKVSPAEFHQIVEDLGFASNKEFRSNYLNVARLVAEVMTRKLRLERARPNDFSQARSNDLDAAKYLLRQLLRFKQGNDGSRVIILDRVTGEVRWESVLESVNIETLTSDRISFLPSHPRGSRPIASEFGIRIDGRTVVSFQVKHRRGSARGTARNYEFSDITTRLRL